MSLGQSRQEILPQMRREETSVEQHDRFAGAARSERVTVHTDTSEVDEFTAH